MQSAPEPTPAITFQANPATITLGETSVLIWQTENADSASIDNGIGTVTANGSMSVSPTATTTYTLTATGFDGTTASDSVTVTVNTPAPVVSFSADPVTILDGENSTLSWTTTYADAVSIDNGIGTVPASGSTSVTPSATTTYILAAIGAGGTSTATAEVVVQPSTEVPTVSFDATDYTIAQGESLTLSWTSSGANVAHIDQGIGAVGTNSNVTVTPEHTTIYTLTVTGATGSVSAQAIVRVTGDPDLQAEGSFGYTYNDLIPEDATVPYYEEKRFSLVVGEVLDIDGQPIEGVLISIHQLPQYGTTTTDAQGRFSMPVEGGALMGIVYQKQGLLTSHRQVDVPWNDFVIVETIVMIAEDPAATTMTFDGSLDTVVTHRSTPFSDAFGTRSTTTVFTGDNRAYLLDENGNDVQLLSTIATRATVYPTPETMPAVLPPNSAFTFCVELSVDGAQRVRFNKPVITWVENYLGFDVGEAVPVGYFDRDRGVWVPSDNGVVVRLLDTDIDGLVDGLDADGDGQPDDLNADGSFADEVSGLSDPASYAPDATFWRVAVTHFTPWDYNWPFGPPQDATPPTPTVEPEVDQQKDETQDCQAAFNSFVEERSRIYHEDIPIAGTDLTLHYASNRVNGYYTVISVPASGETVPGSLKEIVVKVEIAGRTFEQTLDPLPDQMAEFFWDGLDRLGNLMRGFVTAHISVGFVYDAYFYRAGEGFDQAFAQAGSTITGIRSEQLVISWKESEIKVIRGAGTIAGGWTLSSHHELHQDVGYALLNKGDGSYSKTVPQIITTVAGNGTAGGYGDDGPAVLAALRSPKGMAMDAAGNLYIADDFNRRVRMVDTNGNITNIAGNGLQGFSGDGGPAVQAQFFGVQDVAVDRSGNLYIVDRFRIRKVDTNGIITSVAGGNTANINDNGPALEASIRYPTSIALDASGNFYIADGLYHHRIRKVDTNGIITTVAGNGTNGFSGDGGPAVQAQLYAPLGIALDAFGNLYIADTLNHRIRKVDTSGIITTVAGTGIQGYSGDDGPAVQARLSNPKHIAVDSSGNIYFSDLENHRTRKVDASGIITTVAGTGAMGYNGDGGPAVQAQLRYPHSLTLDVSDNLYIADSQNNRIRKVELAPQAFTSALTGGQLTFPEEDGQGYVISANGLHVRTIDLDTGTPLREFTYDLEGRLVSMTDQFGNQVFIERSGNGSPTAIISSDGFRTELTIDSDNHLVQITHPDGGQHDFAYTADGLLTAKTDPEGNTFGNTFDTNGRLATIFDDEGGLWQYSRIIETNGNIRGEKLSAEGNLTTYLDHTASTNAYVSTITDPTGAQNIYSRSADGLSAQLSLGCGMSHDFQYGLDTLYKFDYVKQTTETAPSGLRKTTLQEKTYVDTDADKLPDLITLRITVNGSSTTILNDTLQSRKIVTSPEGRITTDLYDPATLVSTRVTIPELHDMTFGYDAAGRVTTINRDAREISFEYDSLGNLTSVTDPESQTTYYTHDAAGRVISEQRPDGSTLGFTYDLNGNVTVITNPSSIDHSFDYNGVNIQSSYLTPLSGSYSYIYDRDRRLIQTNFPSGKQIINVYTTDQLTEILTPEGNINFTYSCGSMVESMTKDGEGIDYAYDGKLMTEETLSGTLNQTLGYTYNNDFNVNTFTYAGDTATYVYDRDNLLIEADGFDITRNAQNGLPQAVSNNGLDIGRSFNGHGELATQTVTVNSHPVLYWSLTRDNAGRIIAKTETIAGEIHNFEYSYDAMGRLETVTLDGVLVEDYTYDLFSGTRIAETNVFRGITNRSLSYSDEDHLLSADDVVYSFDLDGFLAAKTETGQLTTYEYSSRGELLEVALPDGRIVSYRHDPLGRRIAKLIDGVVVEKYLWQEQAKLLAVYDGFDNLVQRFIYADGRVPVAMTQGGSTYYLAYDQVGSLRVVSDASGNMVKRIDYDAFGNILSDTNSSLTVPIGFAGGLHDRDILLVRFGYRDYDPDTGRWTAKDPIGFAGGDTDLYGYVHNNPVNLIDPYGLLGMDTIVRFLFKRAGSKIGSEIIRKDDGEIAEDFFQEGISEEAYWQDWRERAEMYRQYHKINEWVDKYCQKHPYLPECKGEDEGCE